MQVLDHQVPPARFLAQERANLFQRLWIDAASLESVPALAALFNPAIIGESQRNND